ncbi:hypothetical protein HanLR1_Chr11g0417541 [Helianthus annuus]|nr:hypothetical protein HanHA89_Chr11g0439781 [Helianthus annuus]KAJ0686688.1 hypothetical protein HanLR1_Chr11g0417541 [Helianthus annuus]
MRVEERVEGFIYETIQWKGSFSSRFVDLRWKVRCECDCMDKVEYYDLTFYCLN